MLSIIHCINPTTSLISHWLPLSSVTVKFFSSTSRSPQISLSKLTALPVAGINQPSLCQLLWHLLFQNQLHLAMHFPCCFLCLKIPRKQKRGTTPILPTKLRNMLSKDVTPQKKLYSDCIQNRSRSQRSNRTKSRLMNPPCGNHEIRSTNLAKSILTNKDFLSLPLLLKSFVLLCEKDKLYSFQVKLFTDYHNLFPIPTSY